MLVQKEVIETKFKCLSIALSLTGIPSSSRDNLVPLKVEDLIKDATKIEAYVLTREEDK